MKRSIILMLLYLFVFAQLSLAATVKSPNGRIAVTVDTKELLEPYPSGVRLYYSVTFDGKTILADSPFRLDFKGESPFAKDLKLDVLKNRQIKETWEPVWGTQKKYLNFYNEITIQLKEKNELKRLINFVVRAFDEGVAFRYEIPEQEAIKEFKLAKEMSEFHFIGNPTAWIGNYPSFREHQETEYYQQKLSDAKPGDIIGCPLLLELNGVWMALTEANLRDWAGIYYTRHSVATNAVVSVLSPRLDESDVAVISQAPRKSPWRVMMIGEKPGDLIENNMIVNLADPCEIEDTSWITPGISAWDIWWSGNYGPDYDGKLVMDNSSQKYFIDLAAEMGWEYQLVDWTWYGPPFDPAQQFGAAANPAADLTKSAEEIDIPELVKYANQKGVKLLIWLDWFNADKQMEKAFPLYEKWGVAGVKVDFMARDDQYAVNFYERLVRLAAKHHLTVDFHGAYKPTGLRRTLPNLLTREGVLGNEYNKWSDRITPTHNVTLPFTRMLCGPMDYTPGGFRNKTPETFRIVGFETPGPFVMTTRAHQLAQFVVYESPLQVACDSPYNYRTASAGADFLRVVPTTWDDTIVVDGYPGQFITIARQSGAEWFIGCMTNEEARAVSIPLEFLGKGKYIAKIWADAEEAADYPDRVHFYREKVSSDSNLKIDLAGSGGAVVQITSEK